MSASPLAALKPAKPPPTTTTCGRLGTFFTSAMQTLSLGVADAGKLRCSYYQIRTGGKKFRGARSRGRSRRRLRCFGATGSRSLPCFLPARAWLRALVSRSSASPGRRPLRSLPRTGAISCRRSMSGLPCRHLTSVESLASFWHRVESKSPNSMAQDIRDTVILGTGCAGLTAAIYAARANLKPLVLEGHEPGGQLSITTLVENFPGWPEGIQGPDLIEKMKLQATRFGADIQMGHLHSVDFSKRPLTLFLGKEQVHTRTLIIASGASARWLGMASEQALIGHGVSSCATCDGFFFSGKEIAVIGGGDSAMEEAIFLTRFATKVTLIHRRDQFRASKIMLDRARQHPNIQFLTDTVVEDIHDPSRKEVTGLQLRNMKTS